MNQGETRDQKPEARKTPFWFLVSLFWSLVSPCLMEAACSSEAKYFVARAAECLNIHDVGCAKLKIEPVLAKEPNCGAALFVKGWILQYSDGKVEEGQALQARAMEIDPSLTDFWERRGKAIEETLTQEKFTHFDVSFQGAEDRNKAWDAVKYLNEMYGDLGVLFGEYPPKRIPVIVFTTHEFLEAWRAPFIGGFYDKKDGKIRIRVDEMPGGDAEFQHRARHEMTHAFLRQLYPNDLPSWASEGIAEFAARHGVSQTFWKDNRLEKIRVQLKRRPWLTLAQIEKVIKEKKGYLEEIERAYLLSEALVIKIAKERGDSWISRVINHLRRHGGTFDGAFQAVFSVTPDAEMERLRRSWE